MVDVTEHVPSGEPSEEVPEDSDPAAWLEALAAAAPSGLAVIDRDLRFLAVNEALAAQSRIPREAFLGRTLLELYPRADETASVIRRVIETEIPMLGREVELEGPGGRRSHWRAHYFPVRRGRASAVAVMLEEITARKLTQEHLELLLEAKEILSSTLELDALLDRLARFLVPRLSDWCVVELVDGGGAPRPVAIAHADPEKVALGWELHRRFPPRPEAPTGVYRVLRTGEAELYPDVPDELLAGWARSAEELAMMRTLGLRSALMVPMSVKGRTLGAITLVSTRDDLHYDEADLALARGVASRAALSVANAELYEAAQRATAEAEAERRKLERAEEEREELLRHEQATRRAAEQAASRLSRLAALTAALSGAADVAAIGHAILELGSAALHADMTGLLIYGDDLSVLELVEHQGVPAPVVAALQRHPADGPGPIATAARTGVPEWLETLDGHLDRMPLARAVDIQAFAALPLRVKGRPLGTLAFGFHGARTFPEEDRAFGLALADQCALAIERARLYESSVRARREAELASRAKDEFLTVLSHELRTPLTAILGWANILRTRRTDAQTLARALETIERNAKAQAQLIEDILDMSRIVTGKLRLERRPTNPRAVVRAALDVVRPSAEAKHLTLEVIIDEGLGTVMADPDRLQQVAWNLLSNAVKFTPRGGRILISLERRGGSLVLRVSDSGQGISPEFLPRVFERFMQADASSTRAHGGLGLGLAIVKHMVDLHGGTVVAESEGKGKGSTFTVTLPIPDAEGLLDAVPSESRGRLRTGPRLDGMRVLVVDDDADARELVAAILGDQGARVTLASTAGEALDQIGRAAIDVLVSDIGMPGVDGYALIQKARTMLAEQERYLPALALTAYAGAEDAKKAYRAGFQMHLSKPVAPASLVEAVARLARPDGG
jgi:PAS domain S-box-containing protein